MRKFVPAYEGNLRKHALSVPRCISECSGIRVFGRRIKSLVFSTDVAIIKNINADAIIAVYPFTPQPAITQAIIGVSEVPVFCGVGGGLTNGVRSASMAAYVEHQGAYGVVCNSKIGVETINDIKDAIEGMLEPVMKEEIVASVEVLEIFKITKVGTVAGCMVREGKLQRSTPIRVIRDGIVIYTGKLGSLKRFKDDVKEVVVGQDCGLNIESFNDIRVGDIVEGYEQVEVKRK